MCIRDRSKSRQLRSLARRETAAWNTRRGLSPSEAPSYAAAACIWKTALSTANCYRRMSTRIVSIITLSCLLFNRTQDGIQASSTPVWHYNWLFSEPPIYLEENRIVTLQRTAVLYCLRAVVYWNILRWCGRCSISIHPETLFGYHSTCHIVNSSLTCLI